LVLIVIPIEFGMYLDWIASSLALGSGLKEGLTKKAVRCAASVTVFSQGRTSNFSLIGPGFFLLRKKGLGSDFTKKAVI
jgi:hypothetical protein